MLLAHTAFYRMEEQTAQREITASHWIGVRMRLQSAAPTAYN
jgi:hypothetical protein